MKKFITITLLLVLSLCALSADATTMYAGDGRSIDVPESQINEWRNVGWYTSDDIYTKIIQPNYHICKNAYDYAGMIELVNAYLPLTYGTIHESSMYAIRTEAMDLWRIGSGKPIGIAKATIKNGNTIGATFFNVCYLPIIEFEFCYTCYDAQGNQMQSEYSGLRHNATPLLPGVAYYIDGYLGAQNVSYLDNLRITRVVFADGTEWIGA